MLLVTAIFVSNADRLLAAWHYMLPLNVIISGIWEDIVMGSLMWIPIYNLGINCSWCNYTSAFRYWEWGLGGSSGHSERTTLKSCMVCVFLTSLTDWQWYILGQAGTWGSITPSSNQPPVVIVLIKFGYQLLRYDWYICSKVLLADGWILGLPMAILHACCVDTFCVIAHHSNCHKW